jgi:hypothetical protein
MRLLLAKRTSTRRLQIARSRYDGHFTIERAWFCQGGGRPGSGRCRGFRAPRRCRQSVLLFVLQATGAMAYRSDRARPARRSRVVCALLPAPQHYELPADDSDPWHVGHRCAAPGVDESRITFRRAWSQAPISFVGGCRARICRRPAGGSRTSGGCRRRIPASTSWMIAEDGTHVVFRKSPQGARGSTIASHPDR